MSMVTQNNQQPTATKYVAVSNFNNHKCVSPLCDNMVCSDGALCVDCFQSVYNTTVSASTEMTTQAHAKQKEASAEFMDIISDDGASSSQFCSECKEHYIDCQCATIERDFEFRQAKNELNALCDFIARTNTPNEEIEERVKLSLNSLIFRLKMARTYRAKELAQMVRCKECNSNDLHYNQHKKSITCKDCGLVWSVY